MTLPAAFTFFLASLCAAQSTWVVDVANGPGTSFTDLQIAFASPQVAHGDTLIVRAGSYGPCTTTKGVTVLGETGAKIVGALTTALTVSALPQGTTFVLDRITIEHGLQPGIVLYYDAGRVHLDDVVVRASLAGGPVYGQQPSIWANWCNLVTVNACTMRGATGVLSYGSNLG